MSLDQVECVLYFHLQNSLNNCICLIFNRFLFNRSMLLDSLIWDNLVIIILTWVNVGSGLVSRRFYFVELASPPQVLDVDIRNREVVFAWWRNCINKYIRIGNLSCLPLPQILLMHRLLIKNNLVVILFINVIFVSLLNSRVVVVWVTAVNSWYGVVKLLRFISWIPLSAARIVVEGCRWNLVSSLLVVHLMILTHL